MSYPAPDSRVQVVVTRWDHKCLIAMDANTNQYIHWLDDDKRWSGAWAHLVDKPELVLLARVGRADGPRGRKMFVVDADVPVMEPESVTRSPLDVFTAKGLDTTPLTQAEQQLDATLDAIKHRPRPERRTPVAGNQASLNVRIELEDAGNVRSFAEKDGVTCKQVVQRCIRMYVAARGAVHDS